MTRYVLLKIEDDAEAATLIADMAFSPGRPLRTPVLENVVSAEVENLHWFRDPQAFEIAQSYAGYRKALEANGE